jgi:hypothetical protein
MRRVALPLALSLAAHAGLLGLMWALPSAFRVGAPRRTVGGRALPLSIALVSAERQPAPRATREQKEWVSADVEPVLEPARNADALPLPAAPTGAESGAGGAGSAPGVSVAPPAGSTVLPVPQRIGRVVYLLDRSISMSQHGALDRARRELALSLRALPAGTLFQVFAYNQFITPVLPVASGLAGADPGTIEQAIRAVEDCPPSGGTGHVAALKRGLALRPEILFLLTDALTDSNELTDQDVAAVCRLNQGRTAIHVVELSRLTLESGDSPLARLAAATSGTYRRVHPER